MAFRVLHGLAPSYLDQLVRVADLPSRHRLRSSASQLLHVPAYRLTILSAVARFRLLHPSFGTCYLQLSSPRLLCLFFANV